MGLRDALDDCQAEAGTPDFSCSTPVDPVKALEYTLEVFRNDSFTRVTHRYLHRSIS